MDGCFILIEYQDYIWIEIIHKNKKCANARHI